MSDMDNYIGLEVCGEVVGIMYENSTKSSLEFAEKLNLDVVYPDEYTLQIDYDDVALPSNYPELFNLINKHYGYEPFSYKETVSKFGNKHVYLKLKKAISPLERIALQAILGSDPRRELYSLIKLNNGETTPTLLFEVKKVENNLDCGVQTGYERV